MRLVRNCGNGEDDRTGESLSSHESYLVLCVGEGHFERVVSWKADLQCLEGKLRYQSDIVGKVALALREFVDQTMEGRMQPHVWTRLEGHLISHQHRRKTLCEGS